MYKKEYGHKIFLVCCSIFLLQGCVQKTIPKNDLAYKKMKRISQLNGCYVNLAESEADYKKYLSGILLFENKVQHKKIKSVCLQVSKEKRLAIMAKDLYGNIVYQNVLLEGKDFVFKPDKLNLYDKTSYSLGDANAVAVANEYIFLGIDTQTNIKIIKGFSGFMILPLPMIMFGSDTYRFKRISK